MLFGKRSLDNLVGVHPDLVTIMKEAIKTTPIDFTITEGVRTVERQQELYAQGRTVAGNKVTNADGVKNKSNHQPKEDGFGHAVDLYPYINGMVRVNSLPELIAVANHIKTVAKRLNISMEWGGDWAMRDYPHFQV